MSISLASVNNAGFGSGAGSTVNAPSANMASGSLVVVFTSAQLTIGDPSVISDTAGNTYTETGVRYSQGINDFYMHYAYNITGNASNVVTSYYSTPRAFHGLVVWNFTGDFGTGSPYVAASGSASSLTTGTLTMTSGRNALIAYGCEVDGANFSAGSGFTGSAIATYFGYQYILNITSAQTASGSGTGNRGCLAGMFQEQAGGGGSAQGAALHHYRQQGMMRHQQPRLILPSRELVTELPQRIIENQLAI